MHLPGEKRIGRKRNGDDSFLFSSETIQLEKIDECLPDIHAHHRGRKELALECCFLRCPTVRKFQEHGIKLGRIHPGRVPARIEVAGPRLAGHIAAVKIDRRTSSRSQLARGENETVEKLTPPGIRCESSRYIFQTRRVRPRGQNGPRRAGQWDKGGNHAYNNNVVIFKRQALKGFGHPAAGFGLGSPDGTPEKRSPVEPAANTYARIRKKPRTCRGLNWCGGTAVSCPCGTLSNPQFIPNSPWWLGHSPLQAPQHRERLQTSFIDGFHESLLPNVEIEKQVNAEPEDEQPSPNISEGDSKGRCC